MEQLPILNEHEGAQTQNTATTPGYTPDPEEKKAIKLANSLFEKAKKNRKKYDEKWLDRYKMFRGRQWKEARPSYRHSEVINMIFQTIQSQVPILVDSRPRIEFLPRDPQDSELSDLLNQVVDSDWTTNNWLFVLTEIVYDSHIYGNGFGYMGYDPKARMGVGSIDFKSWDPMYLYVDPSARSFKDRCKYVVYAEPIDVEVLRHEYPEKARFIKGDVIDIDQANKTNLDQVRYKSPVDTKTILEGTSSFEAGSKDQALKITVYLLSNESVEEEQSTINQDTGEKIVSGFIQKLKYPKGRKICIASGVLLDDCEMEFDDGMFPCAKLDNYMLPREFYGMSEVEQLEGPQKIFNKLVSMIMDIYTLMGNPIWVVDNDSGVDTDNLFNRPGLIVEKEKGSVVERVPGLDINPSLLSVINSVRTWINETSGATDVTRGVEPQDITAASAINSLQEAAQTRVRQKSRNLDAFLQDIGQLYQSRVFQFYDAPRVFRVTGGDDVNQYFKFHIETQDNGDGTTSKVAKVRGYSKNASGNYLADMDAKELQISGEFDAKVSTGSSLPFSKAEKDNKALTLFKLGVIDDEELLKDMNYPNYEFVLDRMRQKKAAAAAAQQQAPGGQPPRQ